MHPWLKRMTGGKEEGSSYGEECEALLDWIGSSHLAIPATADDQHAGATIGPVGGDNGEAWMWSMGEALISPAQVRHASASCIGALGKKIPWFVLSLWSDEDAPVSHHGGAHGFDICGSHHAHLVVVAGDG